MHGKRECDRALSCQPPAITLPLEKLSRCRRRKDVCGTGSPAPQHGRQWARCENRAPRYLKEPLSSAESFGCPCPGPALGHGTTDQSWEEKPRLVPPHLARGLHLRRGLVPLLLPHVSRTFAPARSCRSTGGTPPPHLPLGSARGSSPEPRQLQGRAGPALYQPLREAEQVSEEGRGPSSLSPSPPDGRPGCKAQRALDSALASG